MEDYLLNNTSYSKEETIRRKQNRLVDTYFDASAVLFEYTLLELYKKDGKITRESLLNYLNNLSKNSKEYEIFSIKGEEYLNEIVNKGNLQFPIRQRYVIGTALACDFLKKDTNDVAKKEELSYLIGILGHSNFTIKDDINILKKLDIPIFSSDSIEFSSSSIERLSKNYKAVAESINKCYESKVY